VVVATLPRTGRTTALTVLGTVAIAFLITLVAGSPGNRHGATSPSTTLSSEPSTGPSTSDSSRTSDLVSLASATNPIIGQAHFDTTGVWATSDGSTGLFHMDQRSGASTVGVSQLPAPATASSWATHEGIPYVITGTGVVTVDTQTLAPTLHAGPAGQVVGIAFGVERVWLLRHTATDYQLEWWDSSLTSMARVFHLGTVAPSAVVGSVFDVYVAIDGKGVLRVSGDGFVTTAIGRIGHVTAMAMDTTFDPMVADADGHLFRIDHTIGSATGPVMHIPRQADAIGVDGEVLAFTNRAERNVTQVDPTTGRVIATAELPDVPTSIGVVQGVLWVGGQGFVTQFAPAAVRP
jgi:hypothetical protein